MAKPVTHERARAARGSRRRRWCLGEALGPALGARGPGCGRGRWGWPPGGHGQEVRVTRTKRSVSGRRATPVAAGPGPRGPEKPPCRTVCVTSRGHNGMPVIQTDGI